MTSKLKNILIYCAIGLFFSATMICVCCSLFLKPNNDFEMSITCQDTLEMVVDETIEFPVNCSQENAVIEIKSANLSIVETENLFITSKSVGSTNLRVSASLNGKTVGKNVRVIVKNKVENLGINLNQTVNLFLIDKQKNKANQDGFFDFVEYSCDYPISHTLTNENIVFVTDTKISALAVGETDITFTSTENPEITSTHKIIVSKIEPELVVDLDDTISIKQNHNQTLSYSVSPKYYTGEAEVIINIDDESIAIIEDNKIVGINLGTTSLHFYLNSELVRTIEINVVNDENAVVTPPDNNDSGENNTGENNNYNVVITAISLCSVNENILTIEDYNAIFKIEIYDGDNKLDSLEPVISTTDVIALTGGRFRIDKFEDFDFTITYSNIEITLNLSVKTN